ncbi:MAG: aldo/keto reductase [Clostridia bacterium]|nr:aldo/keto reductase [Clostridia bacterium]
MIYKEFKGKKLSALGMGCMRLPTYGEDKTIDEAKTAEMFDYAIKNGINYFDTAWGYHDGKSELVVGKLLEKYPRESFYLASKFPGYSKDTWGRAKEIFEKQLEKCRVDHFDFYLIHNVSEGNIDAYLDEKYGDVMYFVKMREEGKIGHLGFSTHANLENMRRFLDKYGKYMEFCQIQLNWLDWRLQKAEAKVAMMKEYGNIPVWVMEPVRGGKLATLEEGYAKQLQAHREDESIPAWAFRFIQSIPEVCVTLSGMSDFEQVKANIKTFSEEKPLSGDEWNTLMSIADSMVGRKTLNCTACRYCTTYCPQGLDIPRIIEHYNEHTVSGRSEVSPRMIASYAEDKLPTACIGCRSCEEVCPQNIEISEMMSDFAAKIK